MDILLIIKKAFLILAIISFVLHVYCVNNDKTKAGVVFEGIMYTSLVLFAITWVIGA